MRTKNTENGTCKLIAARGTMVLNFSDPAEGRRLFDRFDDGGMGRHAKYLRFVEAFGVGVVHCDSGCEHDLFGLYNAIPVPQSDRDAYESLHQFDRHYEFASR